MLYLIDALQKDDEFIRETVADLLKDVTNQDFGTDYDEWTAWHERNKDK